MTMLASIPEVADALASHGLRLVSVMVDDAEMFVPAEQLLTDLGIVAVAP